MEQQRILLFASLFFVGYLLWAAWQDQFHPKVPVVASTPATSVIKGNAKLPSNDNSQLPAGSDINVNTQLPKSPTIPGASKADSSMTTLAKGSVLQSGERITIKTDTFSIDIDLLEGDIRNVDLLKYPVELEKPDKPIRLLSDSGSLLFVAQSGFMTLPKSKTSALQVVPSASSPYTSASSRYDMGSDNQLTVDLNWSSAQGIKIIKRYQFQRDSYLIKVKHIVSNQSELDWQGVLRHRLLRGEPTDGNSMFTGTYSYTGGVIYSDAERYEKYSFSDMADQDLSRDVTGGWIAMIQHYFLGAWVPESKLAQHYYSTKLGQGQFYLGMNSGWVTVAKNAEQEINSQLYLGPKIQPVLEEISPGLELTVDYTFLTVIAKPLYIALNFIHSWVGNWGWAIIFLTILIKAVFYKLSETQYRSMANMKRVQPRMAALKERFEGDRQGYQKAMMDLYKKEKFNPMGGCLPMLVQIPVFIALYWVLLESVEMRQAPFMLWINDLSTKDPYFVLPIIMGLTMFIQQKLNPTMVDPIQAKVMMMLPFIFTIFFAFFPSGLVLYWVVNNSLSILQQQYITKIVLENGGSGKSKNKKK
ncbi:Inner membrane protein translocase and chaperone YidC, long form [hydrothermal vent metagenome]|uniref:Membrane protein insertase YidC n=1 Tax=hydrothermal vent metagenome TaxID=652676 RepID=A0A3B1B9U3_9ZZZZ